MTPEILRYAAFTDDPSGGNPAGVVLDATDLNDAAMLGIAADVGYSETAFVTRQPGGELDVRYYSPLAEVPFCGHATIATAVAWAERHGSEPLVFRTRAGEVAVDVADGTPPRATLTSVAPSVAEVEPADLREALAALRWEEDDLDPAFPPRVAYAGAHHLVLAARTRPRLAALDYDFDRLAALMAARDWTTLQLVHRTGEHAFDVRDPFPPGGVVEDPATGAAAAAFGGYLRELALIAVPARLELRQGDDLGRPSRLTVEVPAEPGTGIRVSGAAVPIT